MPVFDRIEVDVIAMPLKIVLVTQGVLLVPPLPNPALSLAGTAGRDPFALGQTMRKSALDQPPPQREIRIALGAASIVNGCQARTRRNAARHKSIRSVKRARRRSARLTVKK
jgi:hypothetical protein